MGSCMITVLIVEDSPVARDFLQHILSADPDIQVIGTAHDGEAAIDAVQRRKPEVTTTFRAIEAGALAVMPRPQGIGHPEHKSAAQELVQTVKLMSEVKVVRR